jgi:negative regulator of flagellin synthesis FlgM
MTNLISTLYSSSPSLDKATLEKSKRKALEPVSDGQTETAKAAKSAGKDEVVLSDIAKRAMAEPSFDRNKVDAIKQAIKDGNYPLNAKRIAESFVAIEKMIGK